MAMLLGSPAPSPLSTALNALDALFTHDERDVFFSSLDKITPSFESPSTAAPPEADRYEIEDDDWRWLATQVGTRTQQELAQLAHNEYEKMALEDPDLVRRAQPL